MARSPALVVCALLYSGQSAADADQIDLRNQTAASKPVMWAAPDPVAPHMATVDAEGAAVYSLPIVIPPAIVAPQLAFVYSSSTTVSREVAFGWTLSGLLQIERPTQSAYSIGARDMFGDGEYLLSGEGFSGVLRRSTTPGHFTLHSSTPNLIVTADISFDESWTVRSSSGERWTVSAVGTVGASSTVEPNLWRVTQKLDQYGNEIAYAYDEFGRVETIFYGQNPGLSKDSTVKLYFVYPQVPIITRFDGRSGALDELHPELLEIDVNVLNAAGKWDVGAKYQLGSEPDLTFGVTRATWIDHFGYDTIPGPATYAPGVAFEYAPTDPENEGIESTTSWEHTYSLTEVTPTEVGYATSNYVNKNETCEMGGGCTT